MSEELDYISTLPQEILLHIYSYIPLSCPILRKVNRQWRALLANVDVDVVFCIENAAMNGLVPTLGKLSSRAISKYVSLRCFNLLLRANFTWTICEIWRDNTFLFMIQQAAVKHIHRYVCLSNTDATHAQCSTKQCDVADKLLVRLISSCETHNELFLEMIIMTNNNYLITEAHKLGIRFKGSLYYNIHRIATIKILIEIGCAFPDDLVERTIKHAAMCRTAGVCDKCTFLLQYFTAHGMFTKRHMCMIHSCGLYPFIVVLLNEPNFHEIYE